jgi:PAS domain S-box-containing protein
VVQVPGRADGNAVGTLCAIDNAARVWTSDQLDALARLGRQVVAQLELRRIAVAARRRAADADRAFEESPELLLVLGPDGALQRANAACRNTLGWSPEAVVGLRIQTELHPDDVPHFAALHEQGGAARLQEFRLRGPDGSWRWLSARGRLDTGAGEFQLSARVVTAAKLAEAHLRGLRRDHAEMIE